MRILLRFCAVTIFTFVDANKDNECNDIYTAQTTMNHNPKQNKCIFDNVLMNESFDSCVRAQSKHEHRSWFNVRWNGLKTEILYAQKTDYQISLTKRINVQLQLGASKHCCRAVRRDNNNAKRIRIETQRLSWLHCTESNEKFTVCHRIHMLVATNLFLDFRLSFLCIVFGLGRYRRRRCRRHQRRLLAERTDFYK